MKKINWSVRFSRKNWLFILRFAGALLVPVLAYLNMEITDLTTWQSVGDIIQSIVFNPYLLLLMIYNAVSLIPDPTTQGIGDSEQALEYQEPK